MASASLIGTRVYSDVPTGDKEPAQREHQRIPLFNRIVAMITMGLYCGFVNVLILLGLAAIFYVWPRYVLLLIWSTVLLPARPVLWAWFCKLWVFKTWRQYFSYSFVFEEKLDSTKRYILYEAPHGTFPIGPIAAGTLCQTLFPDAPIYSVAATSVFTIPFWKHFITWIGSVPATKSNFKRLLKDGSVAVVVGGIAEMYMCHPKKERIKMLGRKGFVRIALEEQVDGIVPVFYFGNAQAFSFGPAFLEGVSRKWRTSLGVLYGVWGLPIPRRVKMFLVHGKPVPVPKVAKDDPEFERHVDELLAAAVKGMQDVYERHRADYGWADRPLSIEQRWHVQCAWQEKQASGRNAPPPTPCELGMDELSGRAGQHGLCGIRDAGTMGPKLAVCAPMFACLIPAVGVFVLASVHLQDPDVCWHDIVFQCDCSR